MRFHVVILAGLLAGAALPAQQNLAIYISRGPTTISGVLCGFNCSDPANLGAAATTVSTVIDVRLIGDTGMPAALLAGLGPAAQCPGITFPGVANNLLIQPTSLVTMAFATAIAPGGRTTCNPSGGLQLLLSSFVIPPAAAGLTVTFQGVVFDNAQVSFTRAIDLTIT